jgi:hypothetical protein
MSQNRFTLFFICRLFGLKHVFLISYIRPQSHLLHLQVEYRVPAVGVNSPGKYLKVSFVLYMWLLQVFWSVAYLDFQDLFDCPNYKLSENFTRAYIYRKLFDLISFYSSVSVWSTTFYIALRSLLHDTCDWNSSYHSLKTYCGTKICGNSLSCMDLYIKVEDDKSLNLWFWKCW